MSEEALRASALLLARSTLESYRRIREGGGMLPLDYDIAAARLAVDAARLEQEARAVQSVIELDAVERGWLDNLRAFPIGSTIPVKVGDMMNLFVELGIQGNELAKEVLRIAAAGESRAHWGKVASVED